MTRLLKTYASFLLSCCLLAACNDPKDSDKDGIPDDKDACPTVAAKTKDGCPVEEKIGAVRLFMDRSGSMTGYYKGGTDFVHTVQEMLVGIEANRSISNIWLVGEKPQEFQGDARKFREVMSTDKLGNTESSMMNKIFDFIAAKTDSNDVSIFVSDGILSYTDKQISANKNINKENAAGLGSEMRSTFQQLKKKDFAASIYAFRSSYTGTYYSYSNAKTTLSGTQRPYYIWVIGRRPLLSKFDRELESNSSFRPEEQLHFGLGDETITKGNIIPGIERGAGNEWRIGEAGKGLEEIGKKGAQFCYAINTKNLPAYASKTGYLKEHLILEPKGCEAKMEIKEKGDVDRKKITGKRSQENDFEEATQLLIISVSRMNTKDASLSITMPATANTWYQNWSCDDDANLQRACAGKTFALRYLIDGVKDAYNSADRNFIDIAIPLSQ